MSLRNVPFLTWAGVRGGISVALALSIPESPPDPASLPPTYGVVLFSIVVQGLTLGWVARKTNVTRNQTRDSARKCWPTLSSREEHSTKLTGAIRAPGGAS